MSCSLAEPSGCAAPRSSADATSALASLIPLFDCTVVLCMNDTCAPAWNRLRVLAPTAGQVYIWDATKANAELDLETKWQRLAHKRGSRHHYLVAQSFVLIARRYLYHHQNVLILEHDFAEGGEQCGSPKLISLVDSTRRFLRSQKWSVLRLGYDLIAYADERAASWCAAGHCRPECICTPVTDHICSLARRNASSSACDIRSMVAIAFHQRTERALTEYGHNILAGASVKRGIDMRVPDIFRDRAPFEQVHLLIGSTIVQNDVHTQTGPNGSLLFNHTPTVAQRNMRLFARDCVSGVTLVA